MACPSCTIARIALRERTWANAHIEHHLIQKTPRGQCRRPGIVAKIVQTGVFRELVKIGFWCSFFLDLGSTFELYAKNCIGTSLQTFSQFHFFVYFFTCERYFDVREHQHRWSHISSRDRCLSIRVFRPNNYTWNDINQRRFRYSYFASRSRTSIQLRIHNSTLHPQLEVKSNSSEDMMPVSPHQAAKRVLVSLLVSLARGSELVGDMTSLTPQWRAKSFCENMAA